jgi:peptidoglycan/LPS O-acetylase OafA/YrhL
VEGQGRTAAIPHISALDGARGMAVAGVLLFHGGHLLGGYLGVDFFFTLSGFLITSLLLAESGRAGSVGLGGFWARRARRLLPALAVLMVGVALYSWTIATPDQLSQIRGDAFATLGYVANWHEIFSHQSYFALFTTPSPLNHTWSLAIEEQFYVIWPLIFVGLLSRFKQATPKAVLVTSLVLAAVSSVLMITLYDPANTNRSYFGTDTRAAAILFGAALAAWLTVHGPARSRRSRVAVEAIGLAGAVVLAIAWTRLDGQSSTLYRGGFLLCGLAATAVIAAAVHPEPGPLSRVLSLRPLCALGLISYGVYLYHWPIDVVFDQHRLGIRSWPLFLTQTAITLTIATVSYRVVEQPIRRGALTSRQWRQFTPAVAVGLAVAVVAATTGAHPRIAAASSGEKAVLAATLARQDAPPGSRRIMLVGNSVAYLLGPAFQKIRVDPPLAVFNAGIPACNFPPDVIAPPVSASGASVKRAPCHPDWEAAALDQFRPDIVFWVVSDAAKSGLRLRGHSVQSCTEPYDSNYQQSLRREIAILGSHGAKVAITTEAYSRVFGGANADRETDCNNRLRREVAHETGAALVDLFSYICPNGQCRARQNGVTLRPDGEHYDGPGALIVAKWMLHQVDASH